LAFASRFLTHVSVFAAAGAILIRLVEGTTLADALAFLWPGEALSQIEDEIHELL
jgi:hypothetical protein